MVAQVWWPRSALRRRVRSGTAHVPHCVRNVSAVFPHYFRSISAVLPPRSLVPALFSLSFRSFSAPFPQPFRIVSAVLGSFLQVLASVTIDNRAGFPALLSMVSRDCLAKNEEHSLAKKSFMFDGVEG